MFTFYDEGLKDVASKVYELNKSYFFKREISKDSLERYQIEGIRKTLNYVKQNSPFYKEYFSKYSDSFFTNISFEDFSKLPFTDKKTLRNQMFNMLSKPVEDCCFFYETTGTTGKATPCPRDYVDTIYNNAAITSCLSTILKKPGKRHIVGVCGPTELHSFGDTLGDVCKNMGLAIAKFWAYSPMIGIKKSIEILREINVSAMMCTTGMILTMAKYAKESGLNLHKDFDLEVIMVTGELCSPAMAKNIESLWGAKTYNFLYGSQEALVLATTVENGKLHTFPINFYYEIIDPDTLQHVDKTENYYEGELVITMLFQGSKPLVRYRTGDVVRLYDSTKEDIFPAPTIEILGRVQDGILLNGTLIQAYDLEQLLMGEVSECLGYQMIIYNNGEDKIDIKIEMLDRQSQNTKLADRIVMIFLEKFHLRVNVLFSELGAIVTTGSMVSWKAARIIDMRKKEIDAERVAAENIAKNRDIVLGIKNNNSQVV